MCYSPMVQKSLKVLESDFGVTSVRESFEAYKDLHASDPKKFPDFSREQIFPGHFAPVVTAGHVEPMRYGAWPSPEILDPGRYTTYNARVENLGAPFWLACPELATGVVKVKAFLEWVLVADLIKDRKVKIGEVERLFEGRAEARKRAAVEAGKKYRPSEAEKKPASERKVTILISPDGDEELYVPVFVSRHLASADFKGPRGGFAIITGPAPAEILKAGHDRCPIHLKRDAAIEWLKSKPLERAALKRQNEIHFNYRLSGT